MQQIILTFCLIQLLFFAGESSKVILLIGPSQFGKTSFILHNQNCERSLKVGDYTGKSVTKEIRKVVCSDNYLYPGQIVTFIDTPGFFDSEVGLEDQQIQDYIREQLVTMDGANLKFSIDAIIMLDSFKSEAERCTRILAQLKQLFGTEVKSSIVVVANKKSLFSERIQNKMMKRLEEFCQQNNLLGPVPYDTQYEDLTFTKWQKQEQNILLLQFLRKVQPISIAKSQQIVNKIKLIENDLRSSQYRTQTRLQLYTEVIKLCEYVKTNVFDHYDCQYYNQYLPRKCGFFLFKTCYEQQKICNPIYREEITKKCIEVKRDVPYSENVITFFEDDYYLTSAFKKFEVESQQFARYLN